MYNFSARWYCCWAAKKLSKRARLSDIYGATNLEDLSLHVASPLLPVATKEWFVFFLSTFSVNELIFALTTHA